MSYINNVVSPSVYNHIDHMLEFAAVREGKIRKHFPSLCVKTCGASLPAQKCVVLVQVSFLRDQMLN